MPTEFWSNAEFRSALPLVIVLVASLVVIIIDLIFPRQKLSLVVLLSIIGFGAASVLVGGATLVTDGEAFGGFLRYEHLARWGILLCLAAGVLIALLSPRTVRLYELPAAEYYALLLFAVLGMMILCLGFELITIFLSVELIAVATYVLIGLRRQSPTSAEAALKYFVLSAFASAFLIFGFAFMYGGAKASTLLSRMTLAMTRTEPPWAAGCVALGLALAIAGFAFKLALVPFHLYAADVYEGAPTPVAALLATGTKVAGFVALLHVLSPVREHVTLATRAFSIDLSNLLWVLAALSIVVGNAVALMQRNIKRMLAYSSIAHSGYILIGVLAYAADSAVTEHVEKALIVYMFGYVLMNVAAFGVALTIGEKGESNIDDYAGLARRSPGRALCMTIAMLSLTGIPATVGFVAKFYIFRLGVEVGYVLLVVIAVVGSLISAYYYLRVVVYMYMREPAEKVEAEPVAFTQTLGLVLATAPIIAFGLLPQPLFTLIDVL